VDNNVDDIHFDTTATILHNLQNDLLRLQERAQQLLQQRTQENDDRHDAQPEQRRRQHKKTRVFPTTTTQKVS
jgi:hypothetical protein